MRCHLADVPLRREQCAKTQTPVLAALHFHPEVRKQNDGPLHALQEVSYDPKLLLSWFAVNGFFLVEKQIACLLLLSLDWGS
jgi:hypothetical protein